MKIGKVCWWIGFMLFEVTITTKQILTSRDLSPWPQSYVGNKAYADPLFALWWTEMIMLAFFGVIYLLMFLVRRRARSVSQVAGLVSSKQWHTAAGIVAGLAGIIVSLRMIF